MATLREKIIERIDYHVEMYQEEIEDSIKNVSTLDDEECEIVGYNMKKIRNLRKLQNILREGKIPGPGAIQVQYFSVLEEMMDLDI